MGLVLGGLVVHLLDRDVHGAGPGRPGGISTGQECGAGPDSRQGYGIFMYGEVCHLHCMFKDVSNRGLKPSPVF